jgi:hypothetical protein
MSIFFLHPDPRCQKALADFLEQKRSAMPRFYFIGDDDLLEILGQAKNPLVIQVGVCGGGGQATPR